MGLSEEAKKKIVENNAEITRLLNENEEILRENGYNPPKYNEALNNNEKIGFPSGYIRTVSFFITDYHLINIIPNKQTRHNVTYALELSDLLNYIINRINIWGAVKTILYKISVVNFVSIMEAILLEAANNICYRPSSCGKQTDCSCHFSREARNNAKKALEELVEKEIIHYSKDDMIRVQYIIDLRNRIHIRLTKGNEMNMSDFNISLYNETVEILRYIDEQIYKNGVPLYRCNCQK